MSGAGEVLVAAIELKGGKARVFAKCGRRDLIGRDAIVKRRAALMRIRAGEPEGAASVRILGVSIGESLHDGDVVLVTRERCESGRQSKTWASLFAVREPRLLGHSVTHGDEDHALGRRDGCGSRSETAIADGLQKRQRQCGRAGAEEVAACLHDVNGGGTDYLEWNSSLRINV